MRAVRTTLLLVLCLTLVAACGPQAALIETPAKDMNLATEDVGAGGTMTTDEGLEGLKSSMSLPEDKDLKDASFRMFATAENGLVLAVVLTLNKMADSGTLNDLSSGFEKGFTEQMAGVQLQKFTAPQVGDEATVSGVSLPDQGAAVYVLGFRKVNVVGVVVVVGPPDFATEARLAELGQKMSSKIK